MGAEHYGDCWRVIDGDPMPPDGIYDLDIYPDDPNEPLIRGCRVKGGSLFLPVSDSGRADVVGAAIFGLVLYYRVDVAHEAEQLLK